MSNDNDLVEGFESVYEIDDLVSMGYVLDELQDMYGITEEQFNELMKSAQLYYLEEAGIGNPYLIDWDYRHIQWWLADREAMTAIGLREKNSQIRPTIKEYTSVEGEEHWGHECPKCSYRAFRKDGKMYCPSCKVLIPVISIRLSAFREAFRIADEVKADGGDVSVILQVTQVDRHGDRIPDNGWAFQFHILDMEDPFTLEMMLCEEDYTAVVGRDWSTRSWWLEYELNKQHVWYWGEEGPVAHKPFFIEVPDEE